MKCILRRRRPDRMTGEGGRRGREGGGVGREGVVGERNSRRLPCCCFSHTTELQWRCRRSGRRCRTPPGISAPETASMHTPPSPLSPTRSTSPPQPSHGYYHWQELPQVSFLSRQRFWRVFCRVVTCFVATEVCLPRQNLSRDKTRVYKNDTCGSSHQW